MLCHIWSLGLGVAMVWQCNFDAVYLTLLGHAVAMEDTKRFITTLVKKELVKNFKLEMLLRNLRV